MSVTINGTSGLVFPDSSTQNTAATGFGFKNRIINGAMMIDQRNAGASVTPAGGAYVLDRYRIGASQASKFSVQQNAGSVTPPSGFTNYLGVTSLSAYLVPSNEYFVVTQRIEGNNIADLAWGTANAKAITLSFQVYSSLTGTFGGSLMNSAENLAYPFSYTVSSANTWTPVSITIAGPTSGAWLTNNGIGVSVNFGLGVGSTYSAASGSWTNVGFIVSATGATSVVGTTGATFYITGVQLEKGSTATSFDYRPYGTELQLCQRYYEVMAVAYGSSAWPTALNIAFWKATKRATPTIVSTPSGGTGGAYSTGLSTTTTSSVYQSTANSSIAGGELSGSAEL